MKDFPCCVGMASEITCESSIDGKEEAVCRMGLSAEIPAYSSESWSFSHSCKSNTDMIVNHQFAIKDAEAILLA